MYEGPGYDWGWMMYCKMSSIVFVYLIAANIINSEFMNMSGLLSVWSSPSTSVRFSAGSCAADTELCAAETGCSMPQRIDSASYSPFGYSFPSFYSSHSFVSMLMVMSSQYRVDADDADDADDSVDAWLFSSLDRAIIAPYPSSLAHTQSSCWSTVLPSSWRQKLHPS